MTFVRRPLVLIAPAVILVVALALATNVLPLRQIVAQRQEIEDTTSRLDALMAENAALDDQAAALETPLEIERIAREELGFIRPGESAFVVMDPTAEQEGPRASAATEQAAPAVESDRGWVTRMWDYMTGRDLAASG
jgi:cell division protein FtsB